MPRRAGPALCLAAGALTWQCAGQPVCNVVGPALATARAESNCGVAYADAPGGGRRLSPTGTGSWPPAAIYRAAARHPTAGHLFQDHAANPLFQAQSLGAHGPTIVLDSASGLPAKHFLPVLPTDVGSWANTPEGEWTAVVQAPWLRSLGVALKDAEGGCGLAGVSVYRKTHLDLVARLNFDNCSHSSGVRHVAVVIPIRATTFGQSGLVDWMCALMPHKLCWGPPTPAPTTTTTLAPGHISVRIFAEYSYRGDGLCGPQKPVPHPRAVSLGECAQECVSENTYATRLNGGDNCTGFAFSHKDPQHCLIYMNGDVSVNASEASVWKCYSMQKAVGKLHHDAAQHSQRPTPPPPVLVVNDTEESVALDLQQELAESGMAIRRRLASLSPGCYHPFDWIELSSSPRLNGSFTQRRGAGFALNHSVYHRLLESLPVVGGAASEEEEGEAVGSGSSVGTDHVCVDVGGRGGCQAHRDETLFAAGLAAAVGAVCAAVGAALGYCCVRREDTKKYRVVILDEQGEALQSTMQTQLPGMDIWAHGSKIW